MADEVGKVGGGAAAAAAGPSEPRRGGGSRSRGQPPGAGPAPQSSGDGVPGKPVLSTGAGWWVTHGVACPPGPLS